MSLVVVDVICRGPQILKNYKNQDTGQLAFFTYFIRIFVVFTKAFVAYIETGDLVSTAVWLECGIIDVIISL
jgi:uncharacterized protein with PQ loop repeat